MKYPTLPLVLTLALAGCDRADKAPGAAPPVAAPLAPAPTVQTALEVRGITGRMVDGQWLPLLEGVSGCEDASCLGRVVYLRDDGSVVARPGRGLLLGSVVTWLRPGVVEVEPPARDAR